MGTDSQPHMDAALTVACPHCGAHPGLRCEGTHGVIVHQARVAAWQQDRDAEEPQVAPTRAETQGIPANSEPGSVQGYQWKLIGHVTGIQPEDLVPLLAECARRLGRPVPTRGALSYNDAKAIIEWKEPAGEPAP